jgi:hypothetical protein
MIKTSSSSSNSSSSGIGNSSTGSSSSQSNSGNNSNNVRLWINEFLMLQHVDARVDVLRDMICSVRAAWCCLVQQESPSYKDDFACNKQDTPSCNKRRQRQRNKTELHPARSHNLRHHVLQAGCATTASPKMQEPIATSARANRHNYIQTPLKS